MSTKLTKQEEQEIAQSLDDAVRSGTLKGNDVDGYSLTDEGERYAEILLQFDPEAQAIFERLNLAFGKEAERKDAIDKAIGNRLRAIRKELKISGTDAMKVLGIETKQSFYQRERGIVRFRPSEINLLARYYGVSANWILGLTGDMQDE